MHQIQKDKFHVISPEAFSPKPLNEVQKRLQAILDYWGADGQRHYCGTSFVGQDGDRLCVIRAYGRLYRDLISSVPNMEAALTKAANEQGFTHPIDAYADCSDSSFENARKMVLRAIELAA
jgi:hypothetical protein